MNFSTDKAQSCLYIGDNANQTIYILSRSNLQELGRLGRSGRNAGEFHYLHQVSVDSKGNIYTGKSTPPNGFRSFSAMAQPVQRHRIVYRGRSSIWEVDHRRRALFPDQEDGTSASKLGRIATFLGPCRNILRSTFHFSVAASDSKSSTVRKWMLGELYQSCGKSFVLGARPVNRCARRTDQWAKFGKATMARRPTRSMSRRTFKGSRVSCKVWLRIT